jgi:pyridoxamine 5'-phosphate oxidase
MTDPNGINPAGLRQEYRRGELLESDVSGDPFTQFGRWFGEAQAAGLVEPNAMTVATADSSGTPSARTMLLKGFDHRGFVFFTNYGSRKGVELAENPRAALLFFWQSLERQVRIEGSVEKVSREESEEYFRSRPRLSQIGAWVSEQSGVVSSRTELESRVTEMLARFAIGRVPLPDNWGGYRVKPASIEFWQGRPGRLHDRIVYLRQADDSWKICRLQP